jgi:type I restriction enzyme S subunit
MEKLKGKKPSIRFPEFKDDWQHIRLSELIREAKKRNTDLKFDKEDVLSVSGELGIVNQIEHLGRSYAGASVHNYHVVETGDIVYTKSPLKANPFGIIKLNKGKAGIVSTLYAVYKVNNKTCYGPWIDYYFSLDANTNRYLRPLVKKGAKNDMKINNAYVLHDRIFAPTLPEQKRIASLFTVVDKRITELRLKKILLEQYKKGVMQKLFSQELRFKDDKGKEFPKWEKKKLGEIAENIMYGMNAAAINYDGKNKYLRITDIDENSRAFSPNPLTSPKGQIEEKYKLKEGDIVFARTGASVGKSYLYHRNDGNLFFAGFLIKFSIKDANPYFVFTQTLLESYNKWVQMMSMRSGQPGINAEEFKSLSILYPSFKEQTKIANFLSAIDDRINQAEIQIQQSLEWKKGLIQKMFC